MKVLFICKSNLARSQISEEVFNKLSKNNIAISAGLNPRNYEGKKVSITRYFASVVKEIGYNIDNKISKKITKEMVNSANKIIVIGERNNWPDYLKGKKIEYWNIEDPGGKDLKTTLKIRDQLLPKIKELIKNLEN